MKIGIITINTAEKKTHSQRNQIRKQYSDLLLLDIPAYDPRFFGNNVPQHIIDACKEKNADTAVMKTVICISPEAEDFIKACAHIHDNKISLEFIEEPWLNTEIWYKKKQSAAVVEIHKNTVFATYERLNAVSKRYSDARNIGKQTSDQRGTHPGPQKGQYKRMTPLKAERRKQILELSPDFNDTDRTITEVCEQIGISYGVYYQLVGDLKREYPERVRDKNKNRKTNK